MKIRQALNVEAGLNDGLSVPFLLFFIALAGTGADNHDASLTQFIVEQLGFGTLAGAGIGLVGGWLLGRAHRQKSVLRIVVATRRRRRAAALSDRCPKLVGASMFIAAFVAGLAVQVGFKQAGKHSVDFTEEWGQLFNLSVFFLFGLLVARNWQHFTLAHALYAVLSLTVVRMLPVAIALIGTRLSRSTVLFMGWFGPRGLASIVLGLVYLEHGAQSSWGVHHPVRRDGHRAAQHFRPRPERAAGNQSIRRAHRRAGCQRAGARGCRSKNRRSG